MAASDLKNGSDDVGLLFLLAARNILLLRGRRLIRGLLRAELAFIGGAYSNPVCSILPQVLGDHRRAEWLNAINNEGCRPPHTNPNHHIITVANLEMDFNIKLKLVLRFLDVSEDFWLSEFNRDPL